MQSESKTNEDRQKKGNWDIFSPKELLKVDDLGILSQVDHPKSIKCILHLSGRSDLSGGPIAMLRLIQGQNPNFFSHIVACPEDPEGIIPDIAKLDCVKIEALNLRRPSLKLFMKLLKLIKENHVDLIHCHGKAAGIYGRPLGRFINIPVLHQFHGLHYRHYSLGFRIIYLMLERFLSRWSQKIICVSESECAEAEGLKLFAPGKGVVIHNGVDGERFHPDSDVREELRTNWNIPNQAWVMLAITRANVQKNLELTFEVHRRVRLLRPDCVLVLAGVSAEELQGLLRKNIPCDSSHVICAPPEHQMERLINVADCYLSTTRWEGFSVGLLEALAMKLPAVISRVTGNLDLSGLESEGIHLVPQADVEAYVRKINQLLSVEIPGRSARSTIIERYSQHRIDGLVGELYENILGRNRKKTILSSESITEGKDVRAVAS